MYNAPQKTQQQPAATAAATTSSGTGSSSSTRFRRQKIVPSVVARKIGANTKSSAKVASVKENPKEASSHDESKQAATKEESVAEMINLQQQTTHPIEALPSCQAEESHSVVVKENEQQEVATSSPKPATAFRRIKPKVAIPQTQKPAKSILKKPTTPVKEKSPEREKVEYVPSEVSTLAVQENSGNKVETVSPQHDPVSNESEAPQQQSFPGDENPHLYKVGKDTDTNGSIQTQWPCSSPFLPSIMQLDLTEKQKITTLSGNTSHENEKNQSTQMVVEQSRSPSSKDSASGLSASVYPITKDVLAPLPKSTPSNAANAAVAANKAIKIKRRIKLSDCGPQIVELLKGSIGKKTTPGMPTPTKESVAAASLSPNISHENEKNLSKQMVIEQNEPSIANRASVPAAEDKVPVHEMCIDNVPSASVHPNTKDVHAPLPKSSPSNAVNAAVAANKAINIKRTIKLSDCGPQIVELLKGSIGKKMTPGMPTNGSIAAASLSPNTSHENEKNQSKQMVIEQSEPSIANSASVLQLASSNAGKPAVASTKTIKKAYKLGDLSPQILDLLKDSIGKKTLPGKPTLMKTKPAAISESPGPHEQLENVSLSLNTSDQNQEIKSTQKVVVQNEGTAEDSVSGPAAADKVPVQEMRLGNSSPKEAIVTVLEEAAAAASNLYILPKEAVVMQPPSPALIQESSQTASAEKVPMPGGQMSGGKQIQKVLKLTPKQWQLALKNAKQGKGKTVASLKAMTNSNNVAAPPPQAEAESTPSLPQNDSPLEVPSVAAPALPAKPSVSVQESRMVNIISNIVLPPLNVPDGSVSRTGNVHRVATQPNIFSVSNDAVAITIPTTPPCIAASAAANVPSVDSGQYPKLIILHQPAPALASPSSDPSSGRLKLAQHSLSVTVLPSHTVQSGHTPAISSLQKRPLSLPKPEVTVRQTSPKQTPYASAAPVPLPRPIISVTVTPATNDESSNCSSANHIEAPVDSRIVPKIVIEGCDTADHDDSQASHSSTSSSSSSCQNTVPKHQTKNLSDLCTTTSPKVGLVTAIMGCSPDIRDKLRAKSLQNLRKKKEGENSRQLPRQYAGPAANRQQRNHNANVLQHSVTAAGLEPSSSNTAVDSPKTDAKYNTDTDVVVPTIAPNIAPLTILQSKACKEGVQCVNTEFAGQSEIVAAAAVSSVTEPGTDVLKRERGRASKSKQAEAADFDAPKSSAINETVMSSLHNDPQDEPLAKSDNYGGDVLAGSMVSSETKITYSSVGNTVRSEKKDGESNEFFGFSSASIEHTERDFEERTRTIDLVLAKGQCSEEDASEREETTEPPSSPINEGSIEVDSEPGNSCDPVADSLNRSDSESATGHKSFRKIESAETAVPDKIDNTQKIEEPRGKDASDMNLIEVASEPSDSGMVISEKSPENVATDVTVTELALETTLTDSVVVVSEKPREHVATDVKLTEATPETSLNESVVVISDDEVENEHENDCNKPAEEVKDCVENEKLDGDLEPAVFVPQEPDIAVEENDLTPPVVDQDNLNQAATGVDLIIAMAALRRKTRILSMDDTSDREYEIGSMDQAPAVELPTPYTSSRGGNRTVRNRRESKKDKLLKLLWKHVNLNALVEDIANRENPFESESDELTPSSDESLVEGTILKRILAEVRAASSSAVVEGVDETSVECSQQPTAQNDQRDEVEPSSTFIGDKATEESNELVPCCASLPDRSVDLVAHNSEPFAPEPIITVCDKTETNVATCDTSNSAVAELNNTHTEQVQLAPVSRKRRLAASSKSFTTRKASLQKRSKLNRTALIEMPRLRFASSDGSGNEVVSDCSSDGLSTVEVANSSRKPATYESATAKSLPSESKGELSRSSISRRRYSSSSNSNSSTAGKSVSLSRDGHVSAWGESKPGKRRKLRRRKKRTERRTTAATATVDCAVSPSTSTTSNLDAQYMITEVGGQSETAAAEAATPRALAISRARNNRVVKPAEQQPPAPGKVVPKRGRGRAAATKSKQAEAQELNVSKSSEINEGVNSSLNHDPDDEPLVKCGNCGGDVVAAAWEDHANYHNGAAYRVGVDATLDMKDVKAISTAILRFMKIYNRKELACERCGMVKKSGLGMASHYISCGLSELELEQSKAACMHCGRKMKAVSLLVHQQQHCRVLKEQQRQIALGERDDTAAVDKDTIASGRKKRKSVASAERMIKKMSKEINEDPIRELMVEVTGHEVSNAIMECWLSHLKQSEVDVCGSNGCPFYGMTSEHMRREHSDNDGAGQKPLYQCGKCTYMSTSQDGIKTHLTTDHPQLMRQVAAQRRQTPNLTSGSDSDVYTGYKDGSTTDDFDSFALDDEDEGKGSKGGKGKKSKSKPKKTPSKAGTKALSTELLLDSSIVSAGTEETDVYKEMVLQESIEFKQDKLKYHIMSAKWTQEFRREHYVARLLFADLRPDVDTSYLRSIANVHDYLPQATHSMRYVQCNSGQYEPGYTAEKFTHRWQQKVTFEGEALGCESMFFCGGPVVSLDWLPLPDEAGNDCDQFLAVACKQRYDEYYNCEELAVPRSHKCLVQIWNVGPIQNVGSTKITLRCPRLAFAIACDYGPIWQVAFCPSGCYNDPSQEGDDLDRLGLLAVAGSGGDVHLYALSRSMAGSENDTSPRIVPLRPVLLLSLNFSAETHNEAASDFTGRSVQRIVWSREKGHNVLAAGYSNGVVAVWNLSAKSSLLAGTKNGVRTLLPVHKILHSSSSCITALDLHYSSGSRFLVVCNADRRLKVYDLGSGLYQPAETLSMVVRSRISAIRWMLHFPVLVIAYDDALYIDRCAYSVHQPRDIGLRMFNIFTVGSEMTDLGTNDWHSMNAVATSGGDLVGHRPVPFVHGMNYKKLPQVLTTTIPLKLNAIDDSVDVSYYGAFAEAYGLLFSDTDKVPTAMDTTALHLKTWRRAKFNHYPAVRLNQIRWNPNCNSYTYYAIGYQAGFVRVRVLRT